MKSMLNMTCQSRNLKLKHFMERHKEVFQDPIVSTFFNQNFHQQLLQDALHGNQRAKQQLEISFRKYFFHFRFSKYIRSTIRFGSITLDRKRRIYHERNHLILDKEIAEHLNISQQAVCKTRNIALNHMKNYFSQGRKDNFKKSKAIWIINK